MATGHKYSIYIYIYISTGRLYRHIYISTGRLYTHQLTVMCRVMPPWPVAPIISKPLHPSSPPGLCSPTPSLNHIQPPTLTTTINCLVHGQSKKNLCNTSESKISQHHPFSLLCQVALKHKIWNQGQGHTTNKSNKHPCAPKEWAKANNSFWMPRHCSSISLRTCFVLQAL